MKRTPVTSSQIHAIGYDPSTQTMEIEFVNHSRRDPDKPRSVYLYFNVTEKDHQDLVNATSIGSHFGQVIKPYPEKFPYQKVA